VETNLSDDKLCFCNAVFFLSLKRDHYSTILESAFFPFLLKPHIVLAEKEVVSRLFFSKDDFYFSIGVK